MKNKENPPDIGLIERGYSIFLRLVKNIPLANQISWLK